ncbi:MAG: hypothetical protein JXA09_01180 [Anaerolineae bacterium]|nr:hypothetical protein [Anaerolineae bacterium]
MLNSQTMPAMEVAAELIGLFLVGYGIWYGARGVGMWFGTSKEWWRPSNRRARYPYPVSGILLGISFVLLGARFALHYVWGRAPLLGYIGGGLFLVVLAVGVGQPRFLHPHWYGALEDRLGRQGMMHLRSAALELDAETWSEVNASDQAFDDWVRETVPTQRPASRGYQRRG